MYVLTDQTQEIIAVSLENGQGANLFTCMLPGPGQRLHYLPDVPDAIASLRDGAQFSSELTTYLEPLRHSSEIDTLQGSAFFRYMRDRLARP